MPPHAGDIKLHVMFLPGVVAVCAAAVAAAVDAAVAAAAGRHNY